MTTATDLKHRPALPLADACCAPLLPEPITASQAAELARALKALADPVRLRLVSMVAAQESGEACVCELTEPLGLTQPTISHPPQDPRRRRDFHPRQARCLGLLRPRPLGP